MRRRAAACLRALCLLLHLRAAGCFSGDSDHFLAIHQRKSGKPVFIYHHVESVEKSLDTDSYKDSKQNFHSSSHSKISRLHPAIIVKSAFPRSVYDPSLNLLAMTGQDLEVENLPIPTRNVIIVVLQLSLDVLEDSGFGLFLTSSFEKKPLGKHMFEAKVLVHPKLTLVQLKTVSSCPVAGYLGEETNPRLATASCQAGVEKLFHYQNNKADNAVDIGNFLEL
ncbi:hypothetical protein HGM15179_006777 [Zosterops borbonicus]|uniref:Protein-tyrosine-phosphatase n=1 Tax=Zosterops borbonicus TaxID=364589 RepID=A0A8K1GLS5_9PASS|nr:hypothetical protein HGM15179_006777 [Zosterops borbonicus]